VNQSSLKEEAIQLGRQAKAAARQLAPLASEEKNRALNLMADALEEQSDYLIAENKKDLDAARSAAISHAVLDRIALDPSRVQMMAKGLREVALLPDPVHEIVKMWRRPNGLQVGKMRIPLGVIGMIYEARPNVTADAAALCLKSGNAVILRGGSEAYFSNQAVGAVLKNACAASRVPQQAVQIVKSRDHALIQELLQLEDYIDLIIPRGGEELIRAVAANSRVPVIKHYKGVCHVYVDSDASLEMAERIQRHGNAAGPRKDRTDVSAVDNRKVSGSGRRDPGLRKDVRARSRNQKGFGERLDDGIPGSHSLGARRRRHGRSH
jgi:glutamate-5-semialdehyde dehydrogenase